MLKRYALDPDVVADGMAFAAFVGGLGVEHGRLMAEFPRTWIRMAFERARSIPSMRQQKRAEILLERLRTEAQLKCRAGLEFDGEEPWLTNAECHVDEFDAVIHPDDAEPSIVSERLYPATSLLEDQSYWQVNRHENFTAKAGVYLGLLEPLACLRSSVSIMDPYFEPRRDEFVKGLSEIVSLVKTPRSVVVHASAEPRDGAPTESSAQWEDVCREHLGALVDADTNLTIVRWLRGASGSRPHARWLVTPVGGVFLDRGFALDNRGNAVTLMDAVEAARLWEAYGTAPFASNEFELREIVPITTSLSSSSATVRELSG